MTAITVLIALAGPLCGIGVALLFLAVAVCTWHMPAAPEQSV